MDAHLAPAARPVAVEIHSICCEGLAMRTALHSLAPQYAGHRQDLRPLRSDSAGRGCSHTAHKQLSRLSCTLNSTSFSRDCAHSRRLVVV